MRKDMLIRLLCMWFGLEKYIILWKLYVSGDLYAGDFDDPAAEEEPTAE